MAKERTREEILQGLRDALRGSMGFSDPQRVQEGHTLGDDLGMDSLDTVELAFEVMRVFRIEISDEELEKWRSVADVVTTVQVAPRR